MVRSSLSYILFLMRLQFSFVLPSLSRITIQDLKVKIELRKFNHNINTIRLHM